jgi:hypothetical protein
MSTIVWNVSQLDRQTSDGFVTVAHWQCTATDGDYSASVYSTCSWSEGTATIAYADLTKDAVLAWVWDSVDKDAVEDSLLAQIAEQKAPVKATGVPWNV